MNEDLIEKIAQFVERQCPRKIYPGMKCSEYNCSVHWTAAQIRAQKFENPATLNPLDEARALHPLLPVDVMR